ncbi:hypothetical protein B6J45_13455 [Klebsiella pneumoniae]|nr:hypothetical protein B6J45_13455 [Klebsiella pneumoniae]
MKPRKSQKVRGTKTGALTPTQNGFFESINGRFRDECLNEH